MQGMLKSLVLALLAVALPAALAAQEADLSTAPRVSMTEFVTLYSAGKVLVVDVRDADSYAAGHIPGARSMPLPTLLDAANLAELKRAGKPVVLYCA
jgi:3-mercaptopyruvate sulfurtransferase SseA